MIPHRGPFHASRPYALVSTPSTTVSTQRMYLMVFSRIVTEETGAPDALRERPPPSAPDSDTGAMPPWPSGLEIQQIKMHPKSHFSIPNRDFRYTSIHRTGTRRAYRKPSRL